jgi:F-type H+-transporting ATPase subunit b
MDLFNQTLNSFSTQVSDLSIALNTDIFETNVINITILLGGIIYLGSGALSTSLSERQQKILGAIQESEDVYNRGLHALQKAKNN